MNIVDKILAELADLRRQLDKLARRVVLPVETGSWTPVLRFGGASTGITYATQEGYYTRIGNRVFIYGNILLSSKGSATGQADITGLPFTSARGSSFPCRWGSLAVAQVNVWVIIGSGTTIGFRAITAANTTSGNSSSFQDTAWNNTSSITFELNYEV